MEELLLEAEAKQAEATRRCELIRGLAVHGLPDDAQLPAHWDSLWTLFADTDYPPQCAWATENHFLWTSQEVIAGPDIP